MSNPDENKRYDALTMPSEALAQGGVELLRVAVTDDELFILARPALKDPAEWGEILAEVTRRLGLLYDMGDTGFAEQDVVVAIEEAYAAEMGAKSVKSDGKRKPAKGKPAARKPTKKPPKKPAPKAKGKKKR
jgi:uncharacterized protein DUF5076